MADPVQATFAELAADGVEVQIAAEPGAAALDELERLALTTKSGRLQPEVHEAAVAVVELCHVDVADIEPAGRPQHAHHVPTGPLVVLQRRPQSQLTGTDV